jgi:hypothetical protein
MAVRIDDSLCRWSICAELKGVLFDEANLSEYVEPSRFFLRGPFMEEWYLWVVADWSLVLSPPLPLDGIVFTLTLYRSETFTELLSSFWQVYPRLLCLPCCHLAIHAFIIVFQQKKYGLWWSKGQPKKIYLIYWVDLVCYLSRCLPCRYCFGTETIQGLAGESDAFKSFSWLCTKLNFSYTLFSPVWHRSFLNLSESPPLSSIDKEMAYTSRNHRRLACYLFQLFNAYSTVAMLSGSNLSFSSKPHLEVPAQQSCTVNHDVW